MALDRESGKRLDGRKVAWRTDRFHKVPGNERNERNEIKSHLPTAPSVLAHIGPTVLERYFAIVLGHSLRLDTADAGPICDGFTAL